MTPRIPAFLANLKLRWKLLVVVMPLVTVPLVLVGAMVSVISTKQAYRGITQTSKDDLDHMAQFAIDLLHAHHRQFEVYREDKKRSIHQELDTLVAFAINLVEAEHRQHRAGKLDLATAKAEARKALKAVNIGETGYLYAMSSRGDLRVHVAREGDNIYDEQDENGRYFIREMCRAALQAGPNATQYIVYPWRNAVLGDVRPRQKVVAYRYFAPWDWIVAAGGYLDETYDDTAFEKTSFADLKDRIKAKRVGRTGYIYAVDRTGTLKIHVDREGQSIWQEKDQSGTYFIQEMWRNKTGWIRYPWRNEGDRAARMKIVRYRYFEPWDWIVAVGSYEDEFYHEANKIQGRILIGVLALTLAVGGGAIGLVFVASNVLTHPIQHMIGVIRKVKQGRLDEQMTVLADDELGELAATFNRMIGVLRRNQEMEAALAQQEKMASIGVLSSGVAHEINNPLGVILGYAGYLEGKLDRDDPNLRYISEIKRESKRCKQIVQDLLSYARTPKPCFDEVDLNGLLEQILAFAQNHTEMRRVEVVPRFDPELPRLQADGDQLRQIAINLILNAAAAMPEGGTLTVSTAVDGKGGVEVSFADTGIGIAAEHLEKIFEPFFTTKARGTGLGLTITNQLVEQHHGRMRVASERGRGTTVTVVLPVDAREA